MKIRKFTAPDMSRALRMVRDELGAEAVIISNRRQGRHIELIAASEYDPALFEASRKEVEALVGEPLNRRMVRDDRDSPDGQTPAEAEPARPATQAHRVPPVRHEPAVVVRVQREAADSALEARAEQDRYSEIQRELNALRAMLGQQLSEWGRERFELREPVRAQWVERLQQAGFEPDLSRSVARQVDAGKSVDAGWHDVLVRLSKRLPTGEKPLRPGMGIVLVGAPGVGKTTTLVKLAARFILQHGAGQIRLVSMDQQRLGARAQLDALAAILGVSLQTVTRPEELPPAPEPGVLTLVDTPAMPAREAEFQDYIDWLAFRPGWTVWQVLAATQQGGVLEEQLHRTAPLQPECLVLTQLDQAMCLGEALSVLMRQSLPLAWLSTGPQIPEDLERARSARLVVRAMHAVTPRHVHPLAESLYTGKRQAV